MAPHLNPIFHLVTSRNTHFGFRYKCVLCADQSFSHKNLSAQTVSISFAMKVNN